MEVWKKKKESNEGIEWKKTQEGKKKNVKTKMKAGKVAKKEEMNTQIQQRHYKNEKSMMQRWLWHHL